MVVNGIRIISIRYTRDNNDWECYTIRLLINSIQIDKINPVQ